MSIIHFLPSCLKFDRSGKIEKRKGYKEPEMNPGRELDALVAEKVMRLRVHPKWAKEGLLFDGDEVSHYSADILAAWTVAEKLPASTSIIRGPGSWIVVLGNGAGSVESYTAPLAICLAALKAIGVEVKE